MLESQAVKALPVGSGHHPVSLLLGVELPAAVAETAQLPVRTAPTCPFFSL